MDDFKHCARCEIADQIMDYNPLWYSCYIVQPIHLLSMSRVVLNIFQIVHLPGGGRSIMVNTQLDGLENIRLGITERKKKLKFMMDTTDNWGLTLPGVEFHDQVIVKDVQRVTDGRIYKCKYFQDIWGGIRSGTLSWIKQFCVYCRMGNKLCSRRRTMSFDSIESEVSIVEESLSDDLCNVFINDMLEEVCKGLPPIKTRLPVIVTEDNGGAVEPSEEGVCDGEGV